MQTKWWRGEPTNGLYVPVYSTDGGEMHAATVESADAFVRALNALEMRVDSLTLKIVSIEIANAEHGFHENHVTERQL